MTDLCGYEHLKKAARLPIFELVFNSGEGILDMAELDRLSQRADIGTRGVSAEMDAGLRSHMMGVYNYLAGGLAISAGTAYAFGSIPTLANAVWGTPLKWVVMFAPLGFILLMGARMNKMSVAGAQFAYWAFTALMGVSLSLIAIRYAGNYGPVVQAFLTTTVAFMGLSLYGYTTKKNLSGWGSFLIMGLIGGIVLMLLNMFFFQSGALGFALSLGLLLVFAGLTAYDTQRIKEEYLYFATQGAAGAEWIAKGAVMGAFSLFLNFVNMFQILLSFMGMDE